MPGPARSVAQPNFRGLYTEPSDALGVSVPYRPELTLIHTSQKSYSCSFLFFYTTSYSPDGLGQGDSLLQRKRWTQGANLASTVQPLPDLRGGVPLWIPSWTRSSWTQPKDTTTLPANTTSLLFSFQPLPWLTPAPNFSLGLRLSCLTQGIYLLHALCPLILHVLDIRLSCAPLAASWCIFGEQVNLPSRGFDVVFTFWAPSSLTAPI